jgi:hypothetical protein
MDCVVKGFIVSKIQNSSITIVLATSSTWYIHHSSAMQKMMEWIPSSERHQILELSAAAPVRLTESGVSIVMPGRVRRKHSLLTRVAS